MALVFTDRNEKTVLHSWGRFRAAVLADVVTGDLLGLKSATATSMQLANESATAVGAIAVAVQNIKAGETGWCALAAELKAPVSVGAGGVVTQTYFDDGTSVDIGQDLYLSDAGKCDETVGTTTAQRVGYNIARDRILLVPGGSITGSAGSFTSLAASGIATFTNATDPTSSISGAVKLTGGMGIAKKLYVGTDLAVGGALTVTGAVAIASTFIAGTSGSPAGDFTLWGTTALYKVWFDVNGDTNGAWYFGADDYGVDVGFYGQTASNSMIWDASANALVFTAGGITMGVASKLVLPVKASGSTTQGDIWYDTTDNNIHYYSGAVEYTITAT